MSLVQSISMIKGESSDIYMFSSEDYPIFDSNWIANVVIRDNNINGSVVLSRSLSKNTATSTLLADSAFVFQITPTESDMLGVGRFFISIEVRNDTISFNKEIVQTSLTLKESGI